MKSTHAILAAGFGTLSILAPLAAPVTTVPWNGHTGAVSFTYDDARASQIPTVIPQLDSLGLKATFFISIQNIGNFTDPTANPKWLQATRNGHELANHTRAHVNVTDGNAATTVKDMADYLRAFDPTVESVTFAYPNCSMPGTPGRNGVSAENFIGRGCGNTSYAWATQPSDWMNIQGLIMQPGNQSAGITLLNTAKNQNRWATFVIHDVASPTPDDFSITPANNLALLTTAIANGLWIDTYLNISSYYRAHFTMDTAKAVVNGTGRKVEWTSPHARMPKRVPLRVKLDRAVFGDSILVVQNDTIVRRQTDSSYIIDFMKLRFDVVPDNGTSLSRIKSFRHAPLRTRVTGRDVVMRGLPAGSYQFTLHDAQGKLVEKRNVRPGSSGETRVALAKAPVSGVYRVTVRQASTGASRTISLLILQ